MQFAIDDVPYTLDKVWVGEGDGMYGGVYFTVPVAAFKAAESNNGASVSSPRPEENGAGNPPGPPVRYVRVAVCCVGIDDDFPRMSVAEVARKCAEFAALNLKHVRAR